MSNFERKLNNDGSANPKYVDLLDEDPPIAGQKFACMSFLSPEKLLKRREIYMFEQFVKQWGFKKSMEKFFDFLGFMSYKYNLDLQTIQKDYTEFMEEESTKMMTADCVEDDYKTYIDKNEEKLTTQFQKEHKFQTSTRGVKLRGVFNTQEEAEQRAKNLRERDPNHDIFVGPVGIWVPWDPDAYKTGKIEFMEDELNQLHHEKLKSEAKAKEEFDRRVQEQKKKAIEENIKQAEKSGNKLTQTMDEQGNLVGVKETVDFESREAADEEEAKKYNQEVYDRANQS